MAKTKSANTAFNSRILYLVFAIVTIILGVMFCASASRAKEVLSIVVGVILMLSGLVGLAARIAAKQTVATMEGVINAFLFSLGLLFVLQRADATRIIFAFFPYVLMCIGGVLLLDAVLMVAQRKEKNTFKLTLELVLGIAALTLGICLLLIDKLTVRAPLILGILLIALGLLQLLSVFAPASKKQS